MTTPTWGPHPLTIDLWLSGIKTQPEEGGVKLDGLKANEYVSVLFRDAGKSCDSHVMVKSYIALYKVPYIPKPDFPTESPYLFIYFCSFVCLFRHVAPAI